jgi:hypothetical protein
MDYLHHLCNYSFLLARAGTLSYDQGLERVSFTPNFQTIKRLLVDTLPASSFVTFGVPLWIPTSSPLTQITKAGYLFWRERHIESGGHRIILPLNVSYLCVHIIIYS